MDFLFFLNSILFGIALAMDAFSVSCANGLSNPKMKFGKMSLIAGTFGVFQFAMPLIGWVCVHTIYEYFSAFQKFIPWIALILLLFLGGKMLFEGIKNKDDDQTEEIKKITFVSLIVQGIATSIDALSVGFTIADLKWFEAMTESLIIGVVTFLICIAGLFIGKKFGTKLAGKATVIGGIVLILIGIEIFVTGIIG